MCLCPFVLSHWCKQVQLEPIGELYGNNRQCVQVFLAITDNSTAKMPCFFFKETLHSSSEEMKYVITPYFSPCAGSKCLLGSESAESAAGIRGNHKVKHQRKQWAQHWKGSQEGPLCGWSKGWDHSTSDSPLLWDTQVRLVNNFSLLSSFIPHHVGMISTLTQHNHGE